jgi:hypothetical protein
MRTSERRHTPTATLAPARRRVVWWAITILLLLLVVGSVLTALTLVGARDDLEHGRRALSAARRSMVKGDLDTAERHLADAQDAFAGASEVTGSGIASIARLTPFLGRNVEVAAGVAEAGTALSHAGLGLVRAIGDVPGGLDGLAPRAGRLPIDELATMSEAAEASAAQARAALAAILETPDTLLLGPVAEARYDAEEQVTNAARILTAADGIIGRLPAFAGADGERRYLFFAENPAELRGTGGLWGAFAILTVRDGALSFSAFRPIQALPDLEPDEVPEPNPDYGENYNQDGGAGFWRNMNMTPDFPSAARAALGTWKVLEGEQLDGVLAADPFALGSLLDVTGPVPVPGLPGARIHGRNVVRFLSNEAYAEFDSPIVRKQLVGAAASAAFGEFLSMEGRGLDRLRALAEAGASGHLKLYSTDEGLERVLRTTAMGGAMDVPAQGDLLSVVVNNGAQTKVDYYVHRTVRYEIRLGGEQEAFATTEVTLQNDAPTEAPSRTLIGPYVEGAEAGDEIHVLGSWCPGPCPLVEATYQGEDIGVDGGRELGRAFYRHFATLPSAGTGRYRFVTQRNGVWEGDTSGGRYRLAIKPQTTVQPTAVHVRIEAPAGTEIVWTSEGVQSVGGVATWSGSPQAPITLEVRFQAPFPQRWWRNVTRWLSF